MRKNIFYMVALLLAGTMMTACSGGADVTSDVTPVSQPAAETGDVVELSGTLGSKGDVTRAIASDGTGTWVVGDQFAVYYETASGHASTVARVNTVNGDGSANFTASLHSPKAGDNSVKLVYPASAHDGQGGFKTDGLMTQDGTLEYINKNGLDIETATTTMSVEGMTAKLKNDVTMEPQVCLYTMNLRNYYTSTSISATKLQISDNKGHSYTITPTAATNSLTVALLPVNNASFTFTATTTDAVYSYTKLDGVTLANCTSDNVGDVFDKDGNIYRSSSAPGAIYSKTFTNKYLYAKQFYSQNLSLNPVYPPTIKRVAMIAYVGAHGTVDDSSKDSENGFRGLAIAMNDANSYNQPLQWCPNPSADCTGDNSNKITNAETACATKNGLSLTSSIVSNSDGSTHIHSAAVVANGYNVERPSDTSVWFLPSVGQWQLIVWGVVSKATGMTYSTPITTTLSDNTMKDHFNSVLTNVDAMKLDINKCYWLSTEYSNSNAWVIAVKGYADNNGKTWKSNVRPVLAF